MPGYLIQGETMTGIADAIRKKTGGTNTLTPAQMQEAIAGIGAPCVYQEKSVTPTGEDIVVIPDEGYDAMTKVKIAGDTALKPWNIPEGITIYGVVGTAKIAVTTDPPADLPVSKDDADTVLAENDGTADVSTFDLMVLAQDDGNITYCYLAKDTQTVPFEITSYDQITTEFKAKGWRRLSYHTTGADAGTWTYDDFTDAESGGWNYLKNIRSCAREKLYYNGVEVWPNSLVTLFEKDIKLSASKANPNDLYSFYGATASCLFYVGDKIRLTINGETTEWVAADAGMTGTTANPNLVQVAGIGNLSMYKSSYDDNGFELALTSHEWVYDSETGECISGNMNFLSNINSLNTEETYSVKVERWRF